MSRIAIITGATGGLGQEFVSEVLKENIDEIWAVARNEKKLDELKIRYGNKIRPIKCDLTNDENLSNLFTLIEDEKPNICILINNAGIGKMGNSIEFSDDDIAPKLISDLKSRVLTECNQDERFIVSISVGSSKLREYENLKHLFDEADHMLYEDKAKFHKLNG